MATKTKKGSLNKTHGAIIVFLIFFIFGFLAGYFVAKARYVADISVISQMVANRDSTIQQMDQQKNRVIMTNQGVMLERNGVISPLNGMIVLSDGTKVMANGEYTKPDGSVMKLRIGESLGMNGMMLSASGN